MRFEIYEGPDPTTPPPEEPVRLALRQMGEEVVLMAVDKHGEKMPSGNLLFIFSDGKVKSAGTINKNLGFKLGPDGELDLS